MSAPDPDILERAREGDRSALAELLSPELDRVYAICRRMVNHPQDAEELAQDALVKIIRGLPTFDGRSSLSTWMTRVTINACLSWLRTRARRSEDRPVSISGADILPAPEPDAEIGVKEEDRRRTRLLEALDALRPEHRAIIVLRDVRGMEYDAIGAALDLPVGTVKSRLFRARAALRRAMESGEHNEAASA